ncbi:MAG: hypothetical protein H0Z33_11450 [Bacillaceae bacterium]|nr:hypothetical protein [Bacillaceae bacterium]
MMKKKSRFLTFCLSFVPGLGHLYLGLMNRGTQFMVMFFAALSIIFFLYETAIDNSFAVFFFMALPVIWFYSLFDSMNMVNRMKYSDGDIEDTSVLSDDFLDAGNKKNKLWTLILSFIPGLGHMYLGLTHRGLQIMAGFFLSLFLMDYLRISLFFFALPLFWFYGLFDALQYYNRLDQDGEVADEPFVSQSVFIKRQKWIGYGLILIGVIAIADRILIPYLEPWLNLPLRSHLQTIIVSAILVLVGLRLIAGKKVPSEVKGDKK